MIIIPRVSSPFDLTPGWTDPPWLDVPVLLIDQFRPESSDHRPQTEVKLLHDQDRLYLFYRVADCFVKATRTAFQSSVCKDSCVEFFVRPRLDQGYFNFEVNAIGTLLTSYLEDWTRTGDSFAKREMLDAETARGVSIRSSFTEPIEREIEEPLTWTLQLGIECSLFESFLGPLGDLRGQEWTANFYKCGDETSHPHWASWKPVGGKLNFHQPEYFGAVRFE